MSNDDFTQYNEGTLEIDHNNGVIQFVQDNVTILRITHLKSPIPSNITIDITTIPALTRYIFPDELPTKKEVMEKAPLLGPDIREELRCPVCGKIHTNPEVVVGNNVRIWPGHEYIIETKTSQQRHPRRWRMGYLGYGNGLQFSARGPDRTHGGQYGGTQSIDLAAIISIEEVERDDAKRHVGQRVDGK
jgi:hypothetical protein